jgi:uncharacterized caspase-like protein
MSLSDAKDVAVVVFSGQSITSENDTYLLPYDIDVSDRVSIELGGISVEELQRDLRRLGKVGRVLVLIDACHSGGFVEDNHVGSAKVLRDALADSNVSVITSSQNAELSIEDPTWGHGAFTQALLEALSGRSKTIYTDLVSVEELATYVRNRVPALTNGKQHPASTISYGGDVFAVGR